MQTEALPIHSREEGFSGVAQRGATVSPVTRYLKSFGIALVPWTVVGLVYFAQDASRRLYWDESITIQEVVYWAVRVILSAALTPAVLWLGARWPVERRVWAKRIALHLPLCLAFGLARTVLEAAFHISFNALEILPRPWAEEISNAVMNLLIFGFHEAVVAYWITLSVQAAFRYYGKFREREQAALRLELHATQLKSQVVQAQLGALKMQLQPHFLFNTLNAIVVLMRQEKGRQAEEVLTRFSDLLRAVLDDIDVQEVPLHKELEYLQLYLSIEQMRFSDRLRAVIEAEPDVLDAAVPHMCLQPLVENAIRHGIGPRAQGGTIEIRARRLGDLLSISVSDDGPGFATVTSKSRKGMGLANLRERLRQLYAVRAELKIEEREPHGTLVSVVLPYRQLMEESEAFMIGEAADEREPECAAVESADS